MSQHINIEDYLEPTDPPLPLPAIETFKGTNTIDSTVEVGETMITQGYRIPLQIKQGATTKTADIYIGSSPLTQGQTITKSQSNVDLELFSGDNIIDTSLYNKPDASITYNSSVLGVGERTENLFDVNPDKVSGYVGDSGNIVIGGNAIYTYDFIAVTAGTEYTYKAYSTIANPRYTTIRIAYYDRTKTFISREYTINGGLNAKTVTTPNNCAYARLSVDADLLDVCLVKGSTAPTIYIPYGYQIPLLVTSGQITTPYNYYIGNAPLTAGQSISKTSTSTDIALLSGTNTISTTLGNKPEMRVKYESTVLGVGERTKNLLNAQTYEVGKAWNTSSNPDRATATIVAEPNTTYTLKVFESVADLVYIGVKESPTATTAVTSQQTTSGTVTITTTATAYTLAIQLNKTAITSSDCQSCKITLTAGSTAPTTHIPYGYQIPLTISKQGQPDKTVNIYIGNTPLIQGQSINRTQAQVDIEPYEDENIIDVAIDNKPQMNVVCNSNVLGVGQKTNNGYELPITVTDSSNNSTSYTFQLGSRPLAQGQSISRDTTHTDITLYNGANTISTSLSNKPNMSISYDSSELGVGTVGKNRLELNTASGTSNGVTFTVNKSQGTVTLNGTATDSFGFGIGVDSHLHGDFYLSGCPEGGSTSSYYMYAYDVTESHRCKKWNGTTNSENDVGSGSVEIKIVQGHTTRVFIGCINGVTYENVVFRPMIRLPGTSADFNVYKCFVPITVYDKKTISSSITSLQRSLIGAKIRDQVSIEKNGTPIVFDVIGIDHDACYYPDGRKAKHSVTLQSHDCVAPMQFSARQALFVFPYGCPIGTYHFKLVNQPWYASDVGKSMQFTLTKAIPEGGQLVINNVHNTTMIGATISSYNSPSTTTALESVTMSQGTGGTDLGNVTNAISGNTNSVRRALLSSNNYQYSAIRQWLNSNSTAGNVWTPQTPFDRPPSWVSNTAGFLNGIDADIQALLGETDKVTALNTVTDGGSSWTSREKVFLLSKTEVYGGNTNNIAEGVAYPYYSDYSDLSSAGAGADTNRTKYYNGTAQYWWLRSAVTADNHNVIDIYPPGTVSSGGAHNTSLIAPAFVIPMDNIYESTKYNVLTDGTKLTNGESITKANATVLDVNGHSTDKIRVYAGMNIIDTNLYNNPKMYIK